VDFMPTSGGGGAPAADPKAKQRVQMMQPDMARVAAVGAASTMILPEPDISSQMTALNSIGSSMAGGLGGNGSGGGRGNGTGTGTGDGLGPGLSTGTGLQNPFGMTSAGNNALVGNFYDLKQTKDGKPTGFTEVETLKVLSEFIGSGNWNPKILEEYFKAPNTLYQTKIYIPIMSAALAPEAFGCGKDVQPVHWVAHYRGMVAAPKTGKFRFVGRADNVMVVRFNGKVVLDGGDYSVGLAKAIWDPGSVAVLAGTSGDNELEREMRRGGYDIPVTSYKYAESQQYNERGGVMVGRSINVKEGKKYPVEIIISELGGLFGASLMIEEDGVKYEKEEPGGAPILPLFQLDSEVPTSPREGRGSPAFDPKGPVWKALPGGIPDKI